MANVMPQKLFGVKPVAQTSGFGNGSSAHTSALRPLTKPCLPGSVLTLNDVLK